MNIVKNITSLLLLGSILYCSTIYVYANQVSPSSIKDKETLSSYLKPNEVADSLMLLPPPPQDGSPAFLADEAAYKQAKNLINTPRWKLAQSDADLSDNNLGKPFSHALGVEISKDNTPITFHLLKQLRIDSGSLGTKKAKNYYHRIRPFAYYHTHSCTPQDETSLEKNGSYPSGHTAIGWSTALILAEMFPQKQNQILQRGYDFGQSRVVCLVHWQSDIDAGRIIGAEIVARLHTNQQFLQDFQKSKDELIKKMQ